MSSSAPSTLEEVLGSDRISDITIATIGNVDSGKSTLGSDGYPYGRKIYFVVGDRLVEGRRHAEPTTAKYRID